MGDKMTMMDGGHPIPRIRRERSPANTNQRDGFYSKKALDNDILRQVGQMMMIGLYEDTVTDRTRILIERLYVGNVFISHRSIKDANKLSKLTQELQSIAREAGHLRPLIIATDQENGMVLCDMLGPVTRECDGKSSTQFPGAMALGATRSPKLTAEVARATGAELSAIGINWNMGPLLDVLDDSNSQMIGTRAFGDEPGDVGRFGVSFMEGMRAAGVGSFAKYFPGIQTSEKAQDGISLSSDRARDELESTDMVPFRRALSAGLDGIVLNPALWNGRGNASTQSSHVIHHVIRRQLGYDGLLICDCASIPTPLETSSAVRVPLDAAAIGCDMLFLRYDPDVQIQCIEAIYDAIYMGKLPTSTVYQSFQRVDHIKNVRLSWSVALDSPKPQDSLSGLISRHESISRHAYEEMVTVVRDEGSLIPIYKKLNSNDPILLLTPVVQPIHPPPNGPNSAMDPFEHFGRALAARHPKVRHAPYTPAGIQETHTALIASSSFIILVTSNARNSERDEQAKFAREVLRLSGKKPLLAIAASDPYDLLLDRSFGTYLCIYEYTKPALEAAAAVAFGEFPATGSLPFQRSIVRQQRRWQVQSWEKRSDLYASLDLWRDCLGNEWPLDEATLSVLLDRPGASKHWVVKSPTNELLGLCATYTIPAGETLIGSLAILLVQPSHRNLGIGLSLHDVAVRNLSSVPGISSMHLGSIFPRFFPGVPVELPTKDQNWFAHRGWRMEDNYIYDLYMDIDKWTSPDDVFGPLSSNGVTFGPCTAALYDKMLSFEDKHFSAYPGWVERYHALKDTDDVADAILAFSEGTIVGAAIIFSPVGSNQLSRDIPWPKVIGDRVGGLACVGMGRNLAEYRGRGAGLGLVCAAILELKNRGLRGCFVDWSTDRALYERLGFKTWGKYRSSAWRKI